MKTTKRILAISDIHGNGHLLKKLLRAADYSPKKDQLILLGDYVNKGPDSIGTLKRVRALTEKGAIALAGNHELNWLRAGKAEAQEFLPFLASLPYAVKVNSFIFVHAGVKKNTPLKKQSKATLTGLKPPTFGTIPKRTVVFGHTPTFRLGALPGCVWTEKGMIGIDTGAGHGHSLSLADLTNWMIYRVPVTEKAEVIFYPFDIPKPGHKRKV